MIIFFDLVFKHLQKMGAECQRNNIEVMGRMDPSNEFLFKDNTLRSWKNVWILSGTTL